MDESRLESGGSAAERIGGGSTIDRLEIIALALGLAAAAIGGALGLFAPAIALPAAGALCFGMAAVCFLIIRGQARQKRQIRALKDRLEDEVETLRNALDLLANRDQEKEERLAGEMRVLQKLLMRLAEQRKPPKQVATGKPAPRPAEKDDRVDVPTETNRQPLSPEEIVDIARGALAEERIDLYIQPIVSLPQRRRRFFECFSRIRDTDGRVIVAEEYLGPAVDEGLISAIDNMLLFRCIQLVRHVRRRHKNVAFFCNISRHSLLDIDFFGEFLDFLSENQVLKDVLIFEFAQADILKAEDVDAVRHNLGQLSRLGYRYSMDQITNLDMDLLDLSDLGFRYVKLDAAAMLFHLREDPPTLDLNALRDALDSVAIDMIVEKIESEEDLRDLLDLKIDFGQGYVFGEPKLAKAEAPEKPDAI